ncbi:MAG: sensor histidine kinase [Bowdeniella nasicola]|nr:sensor histidine kinase [Bowdeniella nasicola]
MTNSRPLAPLRAPTHLDLALAAGIFVTLGVPTLIGGPIQYASEPILALASTTAQAIATALAAVLMPAALAFRRTWPTASAVLVYALALAHFVVGAHVLLVDLAVLISLYSVTLYGSRLSRILGILGAYVGAAIIAVWSATLGFRGFPSPVNGIYTALGGAGVVTLTWAVGLSRRFRTRELNALEARNRALREERDQQAASATTAERNRIAREMHDIVAHSLSVMIAQADGGRFAAQANPEAAVDALTTIGAVGRDALADMRKILGVLRDDATHATPRLPQPVDADLDNLVETVRESGLSVSLVRIGDSRPLPPGAGYALYRICQEALTNALKHAGPAARVIVTLQWLPSHLDVRIEDDGRGAGAPNDGRGQGLLGMRERVAIFGGTLVAGPRPGGGFRVRAQIPIPTSGPTPPPLGRPAPTLNPKEPR